LCASLLSPPLKQGFAAFDYDRDGKISANDLDKTFKRMQIEDVRKEDIIEFATFLDRDQDGFITRCERYEIVSGA
jgi:Ca2+-binding EF-hand superfamily protein